MRTLRGDRHSFDRLFAAHASTCFNLSYRACLDREIAEENTVHAFATAARRLPELKLSHGNFDLLLMTAVAGRGLDAAMRAAAPLLEGPLRPEPAASYVNPALAADNADRQLMLRSAVSRLLPRHRKLLAMSDGAGFSSRHIALALGEPERAVAGSLARARIRLHEELRIAGGAFDAMGEACSGALPMLGLRIEGSVDAGSGELLAEHLEECDSCRGNLEAMRDARRAYRDWLPLSVPFGLTDSLELPPLPRVGSLATARYSTARRVAAGVAICASVTFIALSAALSPSIESSDNPPAAAADAAPAVPAADGSSDRPARRSGGSSRSRSGAGGGATETAQAPAGVSPPRPGGSSRSSTGGRTSGGHVTRHDSDGGATAGRLPSGGTAPEEPAAGDLSFTQLPVIGRPVAPAAEPAPEDTAGESQGGEETGGGGSKQPPADSTTAP